MAEVLVVYECSPVSSIKKLKAIKPPDDWIEIATFVINLFSSLQIPRTCRMSCNTTRLYSIAGPNMLPSGAAEGPSMINSFEHESGPSSPKLGKDPVTPELEQQAANRSRFGVPTPDATPESQRIAPGDRRKQIFVHPVGPRDLGAVTPSVSSRAPSTEEITENRDQYSHPSNIHSDASEEESEEPDTGPPTPPPYLDEEGSDYSASVVQSIYNSVISFLNLAKQRKPRADDARVQDTIDLIRAIPMSRRTRVGNLTRTLTAKQYGELCRAIEDSEDAKLRGYFLDKLRFDYTRHQKRFEIRMPTTMHEEVGEWFRDQIRDWTRSLLKSPDTRISAAAKSVVPSGHSDIKFPFARGESDSKSPDLSVRHTVCEQGCRFPTVVVEIAWSHHEENKAEAYKGVIRTVVVVDMRKMHLAEERNEQRLYRKYLAGDVDERGSYSYLDDENNETGEASIVVWGAKKQKNGKIKAVCVENKKFRDESGNSIGRVSLRLPLQDFICVDSPARELEAPPLEISLTDLNDECIPERLSHYRMGRSVKIKQKAEEDKEKEKEKQIRERAQKRSKKKEAKTRQGGGLLGRIMEGDRLISTRVRRQKA
ncbi:hypothetical protein F5Y10DRAFT_287735 [Nemania abortiva]|nr:hypothetical protein F5Y10DRAFT_287735 [Nemania abortiva]